MAGFVNSMTDGCNIEQEHLALNLSKLLGLLPQIEQMQSKTDLLTVKEAALKKTNEPLLAAFDVRALLQPLDLQSSQPAEQDGVQDLRRLNAEVDRLITLGEQLLSQWNDYVDQEYVLHSLPVSAPAKPDVSHFQQWLLKAPQYRKLDPIKDPDPRQQLKAPALLADAARTIGQLGSNAGELPRQLNDLNAKLKALNDLEYNRLNYRKLVELHQGLLADATTLAEQSNARLVHLTLKRDEYIKSLPETVANNSPVNDLWKRLRDSLVHKYPSNEQLPVLVKKIDILKQQMLHLDADIKPVEFGTADGWRMNQLKIVQARQDEMLTQKLKKLAVSAGGELDLDSWRKPWEDACNSLKQHRNSSLLAVDNVQAVIQSLSTFEMLVGKVSADNFAKLIEEPAVEKILQTDPHLRQICLAVNQLKQIRKESRDELRQRLDQIAANRERLPLIVKCASWLQADEISPSWPATAAELELDNNIRLALAGGIKKANLSPPTESKLLTELKARACRRWIRCAQIARLGDVDKIYDRKPQEVSLQDLQPVGRFNFALCHLKRITADRGLKEEDVRVAVKTFLDHHGAIPPEEPNKSKAKGLAEQLKQLLGDSLGAIKNLEQAGPALITGYTEQRDEADCIRRYYFRRSSKLSKPDLEFRRIKTRDDEHVFVSTTEVSVRLFCETVNNSTLSKEIVTELGQVMTQHAEGYVQTWQLDGQKVVPYLNWFRCEHAASQEYFEKNPQCRQPAMSEYGPIQYIPPNVAIAFAKMLNCRLPRTSEWQICAKLAGKQANLKDTSWASRRHEKSTYLLDSGIFWPEGVRKTQGYNAVYWKDVNDSIVLFAPVDSGTGDFRHILGNVAELVLDLEEHANLPATPEKASSWLIKNSQKLGVVGGSALSSAEVDPHKRYALPLAPDRMGDVVFTDVGFRLAFTAPKASLQQRLQTILKNFDYLTP